MSEADTEKTIADGHPQEQHVEQASSMVEQNTVEPLIAVLDSNGTILSMNDVWKHFSMERDASPFVTAKIGTNYVDMCREASALQGVAPASTGISAVLSGSQPSFSLEYPAKQRGEKRWFQLSVSPLTGSSGGAVVSHIDITMQKQAEEALKVRENQYYNLLSLMPAAVYTCDEHGVINYFNERAAELWGRAPRIGDTDEKFCGSYRLYYPDGTPLPHNQTPMAMAVFEERPARDVEVVIEHPDGTMITVLVNIVPLFDKDGKQTGAVNVFQDITDRKRLMQENRQQRELLERIFEQAPPAIAFLEGPDYRYALVNPAYQELARGKGELLGRTVAEVWPEAMEVVSPLLDKVYQDDEVFQAKDMPIPLERDKGSETAYLTFSFIPMPEVAHRAKGILVVVVETTDHVRAREQIETERALLEAVLAQMPSGVIIAEAPSGKLTMGNKQVEMIWGTPMISADSIHQYHRYKGFHVDGRPYEPEEWPLARSVMTGEVVQDEEIVFQHKNGTFGVMNVASAPVYDDEGHIKAGVVIFSDITERKQAESLLLGQIQVLELVARGAPLLEILETLAHTLEKQATDAVASISLLDEDNRLRHGAAPSLPASYNEALDGRLADSNIGTCSAAAASAEVVITPDIESDPKWRTLSHLPLELGLKAAWSMPILAPEGNVLGTLGTYFRQQRTPTPTERRIVELLSRTAGMVIERKLAEAEREQLLAELEEERAQLKDLTETLEERVLARTAQVRDLASALTLAEQRERERISQILHDDLQQLLYSQLMRLELLRQQLHADKKIPVTDLVTGMIEQLDEAVHATRALAAELNPPEMESNDMRDALEWLVKHMEDTHGMPITFKPEGSGEVSQSETRNLLLQIVRELLFNAVKHAQAERAELEMVRQDDFLIIRIVDDGIGFDVQALPARAKQSGGTGLFSVSDRLDLIGGHLEIDTAPGAGTRMTISVPVE